MGKKKIYVDVHDRSKRYLVVVHKGNKDTIPYVVLTPVNEQNNPKGAMMTSSLANFNRFYEEEKHRG